MKSSILPKKQRRLSATELDRALEGYSLKVLRADVDARDRSEQERLVSARAKRIVKLPSVQAMGNVWFKRTG